MEDILGFDSRQIFVNGQWRAPRGNDTIDVIDPSTGQVFSQIGRGTEEDIDDAVNAAQAALDGAWGKKTALERGRILMKMSEMVLERADHFAMIEARDVGKPFNQSRNDAVALARYLEFYAGAADKLFGTTIPYQDGFTVYTLREPHGVAGIIIPWNYPMQILGRGVSAALAAGNTCVLKPAEDASLSSLAFAALANDAGLPPGTLNVVTGRGSEAGNALCEHSGVHHISFTGSVPTGTRIQTAAAKNVIPVTLELGGKSPHIVFDDVDLETALPTLVGACMQNAGQTCSAASRVLVQRGIYEEVKNRMVETYKTLVAGPAVDSHALGPVVSKKQKDIIDSYIALGRKELTVAGEGRVHDTAPKEGSYVAPVLFADVSWDHKLAQEEIFGPVQVLIPFDDEADAIRIANSTEFGLVAGVWTRDGGRQMRMARRLHVGQVFVNNYGAGGGIELPFGGVGKSGHGREKGFEALNGFTRIKTVAVRHG